MTLRYGLIKYGSTVAVAAIAGWHGTAVPFVEQKPAFDGLLQIAGIVFGVLGAWLAIVYPGALGDVLKGRRQLGEPETRSLQQLVGPMITATVVILAVLAANVFAPWAKHQPWIIAHTDWARRGAFGALGLFSTTLLWGVLECLVPLANAQNAIAQTRAENAIREQNEPVSITEEE